MWTVPPSVARTVSKVVAPARASSPPRVATSPLTYRAVNVPSPAFSTMPSAAPAIEPAKPEKPVACPTVSTDPASGASAPGPATSAAPTSGTSHAAGSGL